DGTTGFRWGRKRMVVAARDDVVERRHVGGRGGVRPLEVPVDSRDVAAQVGELLVVHEDAYLLPGGDIGELGLGESGVEQEYGRTQFARRKEGEDESTVVAAQHGDGGARPHTACGPCPRKSVGAQVELCVRQ